MKLFARLCLAACLLASSKSPAEEHPEWTAAIQPFRIADNLYYVGSRDLAAYLVTTPAGNILINANLASSPPQIRASVEQLGFRWADTKILLNGQAHFDHMAGAAEVVRETHAQNMVMEGDVDVAESGGKTDFLHGKLAAFAPVHVDRVLRDGDTVPLGGFTLTAHRTGGHTRGCTTWTMRVHLPGEPAAQVRDVVIVGGYSLWSDYKLVGNDASYPGIAADFERTFRVLRGLPCDVFLGAHGVYFHMLEKLQSMPTEGDKVWVDPAGYRAAVDAAERDFQKELARQKAK